MIIAAAVKFYIEKTDQKVILCGLRHDAPFRQLAALGFEPKVGYKELEQGFITTDGEGRSNLMMDRLGLFQKCCGKIEN